MPKDTPYRPRQPERGDLYRLLLEHLETFLAKRSDGMDPDRGYLRAEVERTFEDYLECGILRFGFARLQCGECGEERLLALSCRRRGLCPSCHAKRVDVWSDWLTEELLPDVAYRQWVITIPKRVRVFFRHDGSLFKEQSRIFAELLTDWMRTILGRDDLRPAILACDQTFGTLLGFHPHQHLLASDGAFTPDRRFIPMPRLRKKDLPPLAEAFRRRMLLFLARRGKISAETKRSMLAWPHGGFNLDAQVRIPPGRRNRLRKVLCYLFRHPFHAEGITYQSDCGKVLYRAKKRHGLLKRNFDVKDAVDFIAALADHIPHKRRHQVRYYGALHPLYRSCVSAPAAPPRPAEPAHLENVGRRRWAKQLWRVYEVDALTCRCGGHFRLISILRHDPVVPKILAHLGLPTDLPKTLAARAPPIRPSGDPEDVPDRDVFGDHDPCVDPPAWEEPAIDVRTGLLIR